MARNRKKFLAGMKRWRAENREYCRETDRLKSLRFRAQSPDRYKYRAIKCSAKTRGVPFMLTQVEFCEWYISTKKKCEYCDLVDLTLDPTGGINLDGFTIDRKNPNLPYVTENICFCCWSCNRLKSNVFTYDEWMEIAQKYIKPKWLARLNAAGH